MNNRLQQFLSAENISQSQFADTIGVARASVSHIIAGRNRPGYDFILSMSKHYPSLNLEWLITGKGKMYKGDSADIKPLAAPLVQTEEEDSADSLLFPEEYENYENRITERKTSAKSIQSPVNKRTISKIIVFYSDNSFEELH